MADTKLRDLWLLDAEDAVGTDADKKIEWLKGKRREYSPAIAAGDWETQSASGEAGSSSSRRGISDLDQHAAILAAIRYLGGTDIGGRPGILIPTFGGITN